MLRSFTCPITQETMVDPVSTVDSHVYERNAIEGWLQNHKTSPVTGRPLPSLALAPQDHMRRAIEEYKQLQSTLDRVSCARAAQVLDIASVNPHVGLRYQLDRLKEALNLPTAESKAECQEVIAELETVLMTPSSLARSNASMHGCSCRDIEQFACLRALVGHDQGVNAMAALPENRVASGSGDGAVKSWDLASGRCTATFPGHTASVSAMTRLGSDHIVSSSWDFTIRIWSLGLHSLGSFILGDCGCKVHSVTAVSARSVASGSQDGQVRLWDVARQSQLLALDGHDKQVLGVEALSADMIASCSADRTVKLWDIRTKQCLSTLRGHGGSVRATTTLAGGQLASCSSDSSIKAWDLGSGRCLSAFHGHRESVWSVVAIGNGHLASGSLDGTIRLWNLHDNSTTSILDDHNGGVSKVVAVGTNLVSSSLDHTVRVWGSVPISP